MTETSPTPARSPTFLPYHSPSDIFHPSIYPGSKILYGGACSSLRETVDGKSVYAIYYDAGYSVDKVCSLKAQYGGNARSLNNDGDFSDPC